MKVELPKMSKTAWASTITGLVAQYGIGIIVKRIAFALVGGGKLHQRIAVAVATYIVVEACRKWIGVKAVEATVEVIDAAQRVIAFVKQLVTT